MEYVTAKNLILSKIGSLQIEAISIENCFNRILATDLIANVNVPSFNKSSYDGYCFNYFDTIYCGCIYAYLTIFIRASLPIYANINTISHYITS